MLFLLVLLLMMMLMMMMMMMMWWRRRCLKTNVKVEIALTVMMIIMMVMVMMFVIVNYNLTVSAHRRFSHLHGRLARITAEEVAKEEKHHDPWHEEP